MLVFKMKKKLVVIGCGYLSQTIAKAIKYGDLLEYELVGVLGRNPVLMNQFAKFFDCKACQDIHSLMSLNPDFVVEAASSKAIEDYSEIILEGGANLIVLSTAAFSDTALYERVKQLASEKNKKIYIAGGSIGGFNLLQTASFMSSTPLDITITSKKSLDFIKKTPLYHDGLKKTIAPKQVLSGNANEIVKIFPYSSNVAGAVALASSRAESIRFNLDSVPHFTGDDYRIEVKGDQVDLDLTIKSYDDSIAAWSVVSILNNVTSPVIFM